MNTIRQTVWFQGRAQPTVVAFTDILGDVYERAIIEHVRLGLRGDLQSVKSALRGGVMFIRAPEPRFEGPIYVLPHDGVVLEHPIIVNRNTQFHCEVTFVHPTDAQVLVAFHGEWTLR